MEEPRLALIDFGMTARLSPPMRDRIVRLLFDLAENRGDDAGETMIEIGEPVADFDLPAFIREIAQLIAQNHERAVGDMQAGRVLYEAIGIAFQRGLKLPAELLLPRDGLCILGGVGRVRGHSRGAQRAGGPGSLTKGQGGRGLRSDARPRPRRSGESRGDRHR